MTTAVSAVGWMRLLCRSLLQVHIYPDHLRSAKRLVASHPDLGVGRAAWRPGAGSARKTVTYTAWGVHGRAESETLPTLVHDYYFQVSRRPIGQVKLERVIARVSVVTLHQDGEA